MTVLSWSHPSCLVDTLLKLIYDRWEWLWLNASIGLTCWPYPQILLIIRRKFSLKMAISILHTLGSILSWLDHPLAWMQTEIRLQIRTCAIMHRISPLGGRIAVKRRAWSESRLELIRGLQPFSGLLVEGMKLFLRYHTLLGKGFLVCLLFWPLLSEYRVSECIMHCADEETYHVLIAWWESTG